MVINYLRSSWRNILKNKVNTAIHTAGMTVAFTSCILLFLLVHYEWSFDGFQKNLPRLYKVYSETHPAAGPDKRTGVPYPATRAYKTEVPGVVGMTGFMTGGAGIRYRDKVVDQSIRLVDPDFFRMFTFPILAGNRTAPLASTSDLVLSESTAQALFGPEDPIGKRVSVNCGSQWKDLLVSAVAADNPQNSSITFHALARTELADNYLQNADNWNSTSREGYVMIDPRYNQATVEDGFRSVVARYMITTDVSEKLKAMGYKPVSHGDFLAIRLAPFATLHFDGEIGTGNTVDKTYLYVLALIGLIVLCIASFNFVNLNVARAFTRAREVGIRKTIGAERRQIFFQLWMESFLLCLVALVIGITAAKVLLQPFNELFVEKLSSAALFEPWTLSYIGLGAVLVSFLAGGYPALIVSGFQAVDVLKGKVSVRTSRWLRDGLITFQFIMAGLLICGTIVIYQQFEHLRTAPLGYTQEALISVPVKHTDNTPDYLARMRNELSAEPWSQEVTAASANLGIGEDGGISSSHWTFGYKDRDVHSARLFIDFGYLKALGIPLLEGRDFDRTYLGDTSSTAYNVIVTASLAKEFQAKDPVGLSFYPDSSGPRYTIIGVIPDFHVYTMNKPLEPMMLSMFRPAGHQLEYIFVKVRTSNPSQSLAQVAALFHSMEPDNTAGPSYVTENTRRWYEKEARLSHIFMCAAGIAVALSCLGLFAIVSLVLQQRRKEIGVRKVLGASFSSLAGLLTGDFVRLVVLAWLVACPVAGYFLHRWLEAFLYHIDLEWWIFPLAGLLMLLIAMITISVQTIRSALANPVNSLRSE